MKRVFIVLAVLLLQSQVFAVSNKVVTGRIHPVTIPAVAEFDFSSQADSINNDFFSVNEKNDNLKVYKIAEKKGDLNIISYVVL
jgi:hypothetical protein